MIKRIFIIIAVLLCGLSAGAQDTDTLGFAEDFSYKVLRTPSIFEDMPSTMRGDRASVVIHQSDAIRDSLQMRISANKKRPVSGYRIRIFFSNAQNAREASSETVERFATRYPDYPVYRSYVNPNFKVTVGDFHSKSDALRLLSVMRKDFPAAFIVRENIN